MDATPLNSTPRLADGLNRAYLRRHGVCPLRYTEAGMLQVATRDLELATPALDDLSIAYDREVEPIQTDQKELDLLIERLTASAGEVEVTRAIEEDTLVTDARDLAAQPPVIRFVNLLVRDAHDAGASDIHLEATRSGLSTRYRVDGVLVAALDAPTELRHAVVSRIKLLAELDIAERRRPQDGRIRVRLEEREIDIRVSTVPTMFGESVVLRLLERGGRPVELTALGLSTDALQTLEHIIDRPHGMLLVTGPTGSGKTTTLYAALGRRRAATEKIITVEDPVEYQLEGIAQVPVHRDAGITFATALRSILRQDPDVVMIGEMRDAETAEVAVQASLTGHLVLSTLHTNDALGAVLRLVDLGVPEFLVAATLEGILAQRLVRKLCPHCAQEGIADPVLAAELAGRSVRQRAWRATGCVRCRGTGYQGRVGVFELVRMTDALRDAIVKRASRAELKAVAFDGDTRTMQADAWAKVCAGMTSVEEALRVVRQ